MDIADIGWLEDIQDAINLVNSVLQVTVALTRAIDVVNSIGGNLGIRGERGSSFLVLSWISSSLMVCATTFVLV
ncbi:unnamed protein product [Clonostachys rosea f. rosea IK726]|uniref:Uncharacterized protein n=1 Tax=Clonostachys rosea f. rosea IK726 TaxID=1349383 RepID=A0ACA9U0L8_BIOOC|nr:unnamed protein product [Clonostachys rosea f. rosea IK726]